LRSEAAWPPRKQKEESWLTLEFGFARSRAPRNAKNSARCSKYFGSGKASVSFEKELDWIWWLL
jgi:hypothetical protein